MGTRKASYDDLTHVTGVSRKSLYATFGAKKTLFIKALAHYRRTHAAEFLSALDREDASLETVADLFRRVGDVCKSPEGAEGCLMANTATSETMGDAEVRREVERHLEQMSRRFRSALERSGIPRERAAPLGDYLTGLLQGLFVLAHAGAPSRMIDATVAEGLRALRLGALRP